MAFKFIIVAPRESFSYEEPKGRLRFGNVCYHKDLLGTGNYVFGGGDFTIDDKTKTVKLSGNSGDFGYPELNGEMWDWKKFYVDEEWLQDGGYKFIYQDPYYNNGKAIDLTPLIEYRNE